MRILYATDGSHGAVSAGHLLDSLPLPLDWEVRILSITVDPNDIQARETLQAAASDLAHSKAVLTRELRTGSPAAEILNAAEEHAAELIVLGAHGRSPLARFLTGSVSEHVVRNAPCSVLLVRGEREIRRVAVGLDGSPTAEAMVEWLQQFPLPAECEIRLATMVPNLHHITREHLTMLPILDEPGKTLDERERETAHRHLDEMAARLNRDGRRVVTEIRSADPSAGLLQLAEDEGTDLLVVGDHGRTRLERFFLGSVSEHVLRHAPCSVLVVKAPVRAHANEPTEMRLATDRG